MALRPLGLRAEAGVRECGAKAAGPWQVDSPGEPSMEHIPPYILVHLPSVLLALHINKM